MFSTISSRFPTCLSLGVAIYTINLIQMNHPGSADTNRKNLGIRGKVWPKIPSFSAQSPWGLRRDSEPWGQWPVSCAWMPWIPRQSLANLDGSPRSPQKTQRHEGEWIWQLSPWLLHHYLHIQSYTYTFTMNQWYVYYIYIYINVTIHIHTYIHMYIYI